MPIEKYCQIRLRLEEIGMIGSKFVEAGLEIPEEIMKEFRKLQRELDEIIDKYVVAKPSQNLQPFI